MSNTAAEETPVVTPEPQDYLELVSTLSIHPPFSTLEVDESTTYVVGDPEASGAYVAFGINISNDVSTWRVWRRYSDFCALVAQDLRPLLNEAGDEGTDALGSLPGKSMVKGTNPKVVQQRVKALTEFLIAVADVEIFSQREGFHRFLDPLHQPGSRSLSGILAQLLEKSIFYEIPIPFHFHFAARCMWDSEDRTSAWGPCHVVLMGSRLYMFEQEGDVSPEEVLDISPSEVTVAQGSLSDEHNNCVLLFTASGAAHQFSFPNKASAAILVWCLRAVLAHIAADPTASAPAIAAAATASNPVAAVNEAAAAVAKDTADAVASKERAIAAVVAAEEADDLQKAREAAAPGIAAAAAQAEAAQAEADAHAVAAAVVAAVHNAPKNQVHSHDSIGERSPFTWDAVLRAMVEGRAGVGLRSDSEDQYVRPRYATGDSAGSAGTNAAHLAAIDNLLLTAGYTSQEEAFKAVWEQKHSAERVSVWADATIMGSNNKATMSLAHIRMRAFLPGIRLWAAVETLLDTDTRASWDPYMESATVTESMNSTDRVVQAVYRVGGRGSRRAVVDYEAWRLDKAARCAVILHKEAPVDMAPPRGKGMVEARTVETSHYLEYDHLRGATILVTMVHADVGTKVKRKAAFSALSTGSDEWVSQYSDACQAIQYKMRHEEGAALKFAGPLRKSGDVSAPSAVTFSTLSVAPTSSPPTPLRKSSSSISTAATSPSKLSPAVSRNAMAAGAAATVAGTKDGETPSSPNQSGNVSPTTETDAVLDAAQAKEAAAAKTLEARRAVPVRKVYREAKLSPESVFTWGTIEGILGGGREVAKMSCKAEAAAQKRASKKAAKAKEGDAPAKVTGAGADAVAAVDAALFSAAMVPGRVEDPPTKWISRLDGSNMSVWEDEADSSGFLHMRTRAFMRGVTMWGAMECLLNMPERKEWDKGLLVADSVSSQSAGERVLHTGFKCPFGVTNRDFVDHQAWLCDPVSRSAVLLYSPADDTTVSSKGYTRARTIKGGYYVEEGEHGTLLVSFTQSDFGGFIPKAIVNKSTKSSVEEWTKNFSEKARELQAKVEDGSVVPTFVGPLVAVGKGDLTPPDALKSADPSAFCSFAHLQFVETAEAATVEDTPVVAEEPVVEELVTAEPTKAEAVEETTTPSATKAAAATTAAAAAAAAAAASKEEPKEEDSPSSPVVNATPESPEADPPTSNKGELPGSALGGKKRATSMLNMSTTSADDAPADGSSPDVAADDSMVEESGLRSKHTKLLKGGAVFSKYGSDGKIRPRTLWVDDTMKWLCWGPAKLANDPKEKGKGKAKARKLPNGAHRVALSSVTLVTPGVEAGGFKAAKDAPPAKEYLRCFTVSSPERSLDFKATRSKIAAHWVTSIAAAARAAKLSE